MFDDVTLTTKKPIDRDYAERRMRWEPLYEVDPDEGRRRDAPGAVAERRVRRLRDLGQGQLRRRRRTRPTCCPREYAREALKRGLAYEAEARRQSVQVRHDRLDRRPHLARDDQEDNFFGKVVPLEPSADPIRFDEVDRRRGMPPKTRRKSYAWQTQRLGPRRRLGARQHARGALGRDGAQGGLRDHRHAAAWCASSAASTSCADDLERSDFAEQATRRACRWAAT